MVWPAPISTPPVAPIGGGGGAPQVDLGQAAKAAGELIGAAAGALADAGQNLWNWLNGIFRGPQAADDGLTRPENVFWQGANVRYLVTGTITFKTWGQSCGSQHQRTETRSFGDYVWGYTGSSAFTAGDAGFCVATHVAGVSHNGGSGSGDKVIATDAAGVIGTAIASLSAVGQPGGSPDNSTAPWLTAPLPLPFRTLPEIEPVDPERMPQVAPQRGIPAPAPAVAPPATEPLPDPAAPPSPPGPAAPPIAPPIAPPGTTPSPGTPTRPATSPGTRPGPGTSPGPGTAPAPGTAPGTAPFPPGVPGTAPNPIPGAPPVPVAPPPPVTTPPGTEVTPDGVIGQPGTAPAPNLIAIAAEVGRLEQKSRQLLNRPQPNLDLGSLTDLLQLLLNLLQQVYGPGSYELAPVCEETDPAVIAWGGGIGAFGQVNVKLDALAELLQAHKDFRQPICRTKASGEEVTVIFEEI